VLFRSNEIVEFLRPQLVPGQKIKKISFEPVKQGPPQGRPIAMDLMGDNFETLNKMAEEFKVELEKINGVKDIRDSYLPGKIEWQVLPNNKELSYGLSFASVSESVRAAFDGIVASSVRSLDEEIDLRVNLRTDSGSVKEQLNQIQIGNNQGNLVSLPAVANFTEKISLSSLAHTNFKRVVNVSAGLDTNIISPVEANELVYPILEKISAKYPGYKYESSGEDKDTQESMQSLMVAFIFAACFIFALLIMTFKNLLQPMLILCSIPLGFIGVIWAMYIHNRPFSFMAMLGVIALAGVIVNNAIIFTDFVNNYRSKGHDIDESILQSARTRIRPILLTTLTTVCGLLPTAYGNFMQETFGFGGGDPFVIPIALALAWGLIFGATMTVLFFPAFIRIVDDLLRIFDKNWGRV
jgi:multidrug efflux pump subunit AcrB